MTEEASIPLSRRSIAKGTAWLVPAIALSSAAPQASASTPARTHVDNPVYHPKDELRHARGSFGHVNYWVDNRLKLFAAEANNRVISPDPSSNWLTLRNQTHYTGLTPGATYQFTIKLQAGMAGGCPQRNAPTSLQVFTGPTDTGPWSEELYVASEAAAAAIPKTSTARRNLVPYPGPHFCSDAKRAKDVLFSSTYENAQTFTIRGTAGWNGEVHFIFDYWAETRPAETFPQGGKNSTVANSRFLIGWPLNPIKLTPGNP